MYIELDHSLVAGKVKDINKKIVLEGREVEIDDDHFGGGARYLLNKYNISKKPVKDVLLKKESPTEENLPSGESFISKSFRKLLRKPKTDSEAPDTSKDEVEKHVKKEEEEFVIGSNGEVFFDHDFGFFGAILACYNNHWVLKTSLEDWWNVIVR